jgi:hypothetical protein
MNNNVCPKCGAAIVPGTQFCSGCGTPVQGSVQNVPVQPAPVQQPVVAQGGYGSLFIRRVSNAFGCAVPLTVTVDGNSYTFNNGNELTLNLTPGVHVVTWKFWSRRLQQTQVNVTVGNQVFVELVYDWLWGGFKLGKNSILGM